MDTDVNCTYSKIVNVHVRIVLEISIVPLAYVLLLNCICPQFRRRTKASRPYHFSTVLGPYNGR